MVRIAGADYPPAKHNLTEKIARRLADAGDAVHPRKNPDILKRLDRLGHGRAVAIGGRGNGFVGGEAKPAAGVVEVVEQAPQARPAFWRSRLRNACGLRCASSGRGQRL